MQVDLMVFFRFPTKFLNWGSWLGVYWGVKFIIKKKKNFQNKNFQIFFISTFTLFQINNKK